MKIRKLKLSKYKIFDDLELDFTDENDKTLNTIVFAGINGTGKTTLLEFIVKILYNVEPFFLNHFEFVELEVELSDLELMEFGNYIDKISLDNDDVQYVVIKGNIVTVWSEYETNFQGLEILRKILDFNYKKEKTSFKICYFYDHLKYYSVKSKDLVRTTNFELFYKDLENYFQHIISSQVFKNRNITGGELIDKFIFEINNILKGIKLNSKIADIIDNKLVFESLNGNKISFLNLSAGEKQIYYRAIYLNALDLENSIILVDEPELSLHPSWQNEIVKLYQNVGKNNQVFVSTHSPQVIGSVKPENIFLLKPENDRIVVKQPKYSKGHSINYVLSEIMDTNYRDTATNKKVEQYLEFIRNGKHTTTEGKELYKEIEKLSPDSEERMLVELSLERFKAIGK